MNMDLSSALIALKSAFDIIKVGVDIHDENKIKTGITDFLDKYIFLQTLLLDVQQQNLQLLEDKREIERKYEQLKSTINNRDNYSLHKITEGLFVYKSVSSIQPEHFLCQNCFDKGLVSVLRQREDSMWGNSLICADNSSHSVTW